MVIPYRFNRMEFSGSLGDLGTLLPLTMGMIMVNGMSATGIFFSIGLFYICAGLYFGVPVPVQPMKVISAYAIATGVSAVQISSSAALICALLFLIGITGSINLIGKMIPKAVIRGIQLSTGVLLMTQGFKLILGKSPQQLTAGAAEPFLFLNNLGPLPIGILFGIGGGLITLTLMRNKKYPAGLVLISLGLVVGLVLGKSGLLSTVEPGLHLPQFFPAGFPAKADFVLAFFVLVLPQIPMTIGNAIIANADLSNDYFGEQSQKVTYKSTTMSMALANGVSFLIGGIPLCHGAGGLAAHYSFGARTGGSNIIIGAIFLGLAVILGPDALFIMHLLPMSILGVLLVFAGAQLSLSIMDMFARKEMFVVLIILALTLTTSLSWGFGAGLVTARLLKAEKLSV